jgi:uncharacterized phage-like protein YoqJ
MFEVRKAKNNFGDRTFWTKNFNSFLAGDTIRKVKKRNSFDIDRSLKILYTMYDKRKKISLDYVNSEIKQYKKLIFSTKIRQNESLNQAHMAHLRI